MGDYGQQPYLALDWNINTHQVPTYPPLTLVGNDTPSRNYRNVLSRVVKPSSAGNSPHSHPRRRNTPIKTTIQNSTMYPNHHSKSYSSVQQRPPRPTSWHPSLRTGGQPYYMSTCHPSWYRDDSMPHQLGGMTSSMYGLSTPITCPISGDLLSTNDCFTSPDESYPHVPSGAQAYTPVEPSDMLFSEPSEWSTFNMEQTPFSAYPWTMQNNTNSFVSMDPAVDFGGHESVASADDLTAPPTPEPNPQDYVRKNGEQQPLISQDSPDGNDLVALGLYDEPQTLSFNSTLLGGGFAYRPTGKVLKLEETFTPAPEADEDEDADAEDDDQENEEQ